MLNSIRQVRLYQIYICLIFALFLTMLLAIGLHQVIEFYLLNILVACTAGTLISVLSISIIMKKMKVSKEIMRIIQGMFAVSLFSASFAFLSTIPLNIDRSLSVWMLAKIEQSGSTTLKISDLREQVEPFLGPDGGEINRRVEEQASLGYLEIVEDGTSIRITKRGKIQVMINKRIADVFDLNPKYANGDK